MNDLTYGIVMGVAGTTALFCFVEAWREKRRK